LGLVAACGVEYRSSRGGAPVQYRTTRVLRADRSAGLYAAGVAGARSPRTCSAATCRLSPDGDGAATGSCPRSVGGMSPPGSGGEGPYTVLARQMNEEGE